MAPAAQVVVFQGTMGSDEILKNIIANPNVHQVSSSWGLSVSAITPALMTILAAQGQSFFAASGDFGAYGNTIDPNTNMCVPAPSTVLPYVTLVGGTDLNVNAGVWASEGAWANSGGGLLGTVVNGIPQIPIPAWQKDINPGNVELSNFVRNAPDVSMPGTGVYFVYTTCNGEIFGNPPSDRAKCTGMAGAVNCGPDSKGNPNAIVVAPCPDPLKSTPADGTGTSTASPLWAGFMALVNQSNVLKTPGAPPVGFVNPTVYGIARDASAYAAGFNDIKPPALSAQTANCAGTTYTAQQGYDLVTGLGSPRCGLIGQLVEHGASPALTVNGTSTPFPNEPITVCGTGTGFTPGGQVDFTISGIPGTTGSTPIGPTVLADVNGNISYSIQSYTFPPKSNCTPNPPDVTLTAHDLASHAAVPSTDVSVSMTFSANYFCTNLAAPMSFNQGCIQNPPEVAGFSSASALLGYGPNLCFKGIGFYPGGEVDINYSGIPVGSQPAQRKVTANSSGTFQLLDNQTDIINTNCTAAQAFGNVTVSIVDKTTGAVATQVFQSGDWCSNYIQSDEGDPSACH